LGIPLKNRRKPLRPSNRCVRMAAARVGPANAPKIWNGSTGSSGLNASGRTAVQEKRNAMARNAMSGYLDTVCFTGSSPAKYTATPSACAGNSRRQPAKNGTWARAGHPRTRQDESVPGFIRNPRVSLA
jgi:hypothetical protein